MELRKSWRKRIMMKKKGIAILTVIIIWHIISRGWLVCMQKKREPNDSAIMVLQWFWISSSREWKEGDRWENWKVERRLWWVRWRCDISDYESLSLGGRVWENNTNEAKSRGFFSEILWKEEIMDWYSLLESNSWINLWLNIIIIIQ